MIFDENSSEAHLTQFIILEAQNQLVEACTFVYAWLTFFIVIITNFLLTTESRSFTPQSNWRGGVGDHPPLPEIRKGNLVKLNKRYKWQTALMDTCLLEANHNGRQPQLKMTYMEDNPNKRQIQ